MNIRIGKVGGGREVLTDERLDALGDAFIEGQVRELTGATFEQFVENPGLIGHMAMWLKHGGAIGVTDWGKVWMIAAA